VVRICADGDELGGNRALSVQDGMGWHGMAYIRFVVVGAAVLDGWHVTL
jgi:hypothetical protein